MEFLLSDKPITFNELITDPNVKLEFLSNDGTYGFVFYALNNGDKICVVKIVLLDESNESDDDSNSIYIHRVGSKYLAPLSRFEEETKNSIKLARDGNGVEFYGSEILTQSEAESLINDYYNRHTNPDRDEDNTSRYIGEMIAFLNHHTVTHIGVFLTEPLVAKAVSKEDELTFYIESAVNLLKLACAGKIASDLKRENSVFATISELSHERQEKLHNKRAQAITFATNRTESRILKKIQASEGTAVSIDAGILINRKENFATFNRHQVNQYININQKISTTEEDHDSTKINDPIIEQFINEIDNIDISRIEKHHVATMLDILYYDNMAFVWLTNIISSSRSNSTSSSSSKSRSRSNSSIKSRSRGRTRGRSSTNRRSTRSRSRSRDKHIDRDNNIGAIWRLLKAS